MKNSGDNLIFLISQPRAGSTLTQCMLGTHTQIYTHSEPWIMLHPLIAYKPLNYTAAYDAEMYIKAANEFIEQLPGKTSDYISVISDAYGKLYNTVIEQTNKKYFLDKTPRYYYIINELAEVFPKAKFIFIFRNPAAVIISTVQTWTRADWHRLSNCRDDLFLAPKLILNGIEQLKERAFTINYENLIAEPESNVKDLCAFLNINYEPEMINYDNSMGINWKFGDQATVREKNKADASHAHKWTENLYNPQMWRCTNDYINQLGAQIISKMGYSSDEIIDILEKHKPNLDIDKHSIQLNILLNNIRDTHIQNRRLITDQSSLHNSIAVRNDQINKLKAEIIEINLIIKNSEKEIEALSIQLSECRKALEKANDLSMHQVGIIHNLTSEIQNLTQIIHNKEVGIKDIETK